MKFGNLLVSYVQSLDAEDPEYLLDYNMLKRKLKAFKPQQGAGAAQSSQAAATAGSSAAEPSGTPRAALSEEERSFLDLLNRETSRINDFFIEKEEAAVIRLKALEDGIARAAGPKELSALSSALVDFHGEMVLLLHWSLVNYAAVAKILKKHDKLTGSLLRAPYLANMLQQPFLSTESISRLVRQAERQVQLLAADVTGEEEANSADGAAAAAAAAASAPSSLQQLQPKPPLVARTRAALGMLWELTEKAATPSTLLPPGAVPPPLDAPPPAKRQRLGEGGESSCQ